MKYADKLKDPRWQKKRLEILSRDDWRCKICLSGEDTLHVHHLCYKKGKEPWEYENIDFITLCEGCHENEHSEWPMAMKAFEEAFKRAGFFSGELFELALAFAEGRFDFHIPEISMMAITTAIRDKDLLTGITEEYFKKISKKKEVINDIKGIDP